MRIRELLEGKIFNDLDFVKQTGDKRELDYDLIEDLVYFMNNDDELYRREVYPAIVKCLVGSKTKKIPEASIFRPAVEKSYKIYLQKFPIRELPENLDNELLSKVCKKMHEEVKQHISDGKYKD